MDELAVLRHVVEHAGDCILAADASGRITMANVAVAKTFGHAPAQLIGLPVETLFPPDRAGAPVQQMHDALRGGIAWEGEVSARRLDGSSFPVHVSLAFAREAAGAPACAILYARDVTDQQRLLDQLKQLSITDDLTGAYNARYLWARLRYEFLRARRYGQPLCCLMVDLDRFKLVNDNYGHRVGDEVLRRVTKTVAGGIREVDIVARYGGEEFAVILPNTLVDGALRCAEHIRASVEANAMDVNGASLRVTISLGVASLSPDAENEEEFLRRADSALITAKRRGRNRACLWSPDGDGAAAGLSPV